MNNTQPLPESGSSSQSTDDYFKQPFKIGILGGGQLGQMLLRPAISWNLDLHILDPDAAAPCSKSCSNFTVGNFSDFSTVINFGRQVNLITIEIEGVNTEALAQLEQEGVKVYPQPHIIELIKDKRKQKQFYVENGIATSEFVVVNSLAEIAENEHFLPAFNKIATGGFDGRGVQKINKASDIHLGFDAPGILEKAVELEKELSVIVARNANGDCICYDPVELVYHEQNMVDYLIAPADIPAMIAADAQEIAKEIANKLGIVGLLAVELFLEKSGRLLVNEVAPRPHNSGHHSIDACITSQFEQHWRAILGFPLGSTALKQEAAMVNLVGAEGYNGPVMYEGANQLLNEKNVFLHLYGKTSTRPYRKMGHFTILDHDRDRLIAKVERLKNKISVISNITD
jgi:5-(carboxyamino)imidazole ribonucleotide synthase